MPGALDGITVLDLTSVLLGPYATQTLGDMGADVIKVEAPAGDLTRNTGPMRHPDMAAVYLNANRNKRGLCLDLKQPAARQALLDLAAKADVFVHSMRPQAIARLGLAYEDLEAARPDIIYCGAYGYRADGPYGHHPAYDDLIQGYSGLTALQGARQGRPEYVTSVIADKTVGLTLVYAITAALLHRERTGQGQAVEVPMFETMASFVLVEHQFGEVFEPPIGAPGYTRLLSPDRRPYATADGYVCALPYTNRQWQRFCELAGRPELATDERFANLAVRHVNVDQVYATIAEVLRTKPTAYWVEALEAAEIPVAPAQDLDELMHDPHLAATDFFQPMDHPSEGAMKTTAPPVRFDKSPSTIRHHAPRLGEHSVEILKQAGYTESRITDLLASGAVVQAEE